MSARAGYLHQSPVGDIGRRRRHRVDQLAAAVDPEMCLHPEGQFFNDFRWLHLQTALKEPSCFNGLGANLQTRYLVPGSEGASRDEAVRKLSSPSKIVVPAKAGPRPSV